MRVRAVAAALLLAWSCGRSEQATSAKMHQDLAEMRKAIQDYRREKKQPPRALDDLVRAHYLREIPIDPVTGSADWRTVTEQSVRIDDFTTGGAPLPPAAPGIVDVHSNAPGADASGKPWSEY